MWLLLITHAAALVAFWWLPAWAARRDAAAFAADGSADSKHYTFHRQRLLERAGIFVVLAGLASLPAFGIWQAYAASCAGLLCAAAGIWTHRFNVLLNEARALAYVPRYYVSFDSRAAWFPDRLLARRAIRAYPDRLAWNDAELHQERARYAASELRTLLRAALVAGLAGYAGALVYVWLRSPAAG